MKENFIRYTLRVDKVLFKKFHYVADYNGRSANKEIEQYLKKCVAAFEEKHGEIQIDD